MHGSGMGAGLNEGSMRERRGGEGLINQGPGGGRPIMGNFGNQQQQGGGGRPIANFGNQQQGGNRSGQDFENRRDGEGRGENQAWRGGGGREGDAFSRRREEDDRGERWGGGGDSRKRGSDQPHNDWNARDQRHPGGEGRMGDFEGRSGRRENFENGRRDESGSGRREEFGGGRGGASSFRWLSQDSALL